MQLPYKKVTPLSHNFPPPAAADVVFVLTHEYNGFYSLRSSGLVEGSPLPFTVTQLYLI
ncbi:hypothetical protein [Methanimicrococcus stummii]|uniref:hypothetical protein n=1 Tax=Methanimicrococcus stummii TaxID=3028294 RepID=UPI00292D02A4|nr:hypothetical protein [Methanimicrococcus sp. Es2]